jgi:hypothetical protein
MEIYYYCRTSPTLRYNGGAARSFSSFADLNQKNIERYKANFVLNRWIFFMTRSAKLEQLWATPPL